MKELFEIIAKAQPLCKGWCTLDKAFTLASIVIAKRPSVSFEIGVYGASSFLPIALAHKFIDNGVAVGVDPWDKATAILAQTENESRNWWDAQDLEGVYREVLALMNLYQLGNHTRILRAKSSTVEIPPGIGLLHVDGGHNEEAVRDVARFASHVDVGGFVVMDDLNWHGGGPARAAQRLVQMGYKQLYLIGSGAVFQRIR